MDKNGVNICDFCEAVIDNNSFIRISYKEFDFCGWDCHNPYFDWGFHEEVKTDKDS